jgi:uncharacterized protein (TIGR00297 family)
MRPPGSREYLCEHPGPEVAIGEDLLVRVLAGAAVAGAVAAGARRSGALSSSGQWAAVVAGIIATAAGWWWAGTLIAFFVSSSALTRWHAREKARATAGTVPAEAGRTAAQVMANGGLFVLAAIGWRAGGAGRLAFAALGALAAASSDTWSTEIGTVFGGTPRLITTGREVEPGMSGGVSAAGFGAGIAGALFVAVLGAFAVPQHRARLAMAAAIGGFAGCLADSAIGATLQSKRFCDRCSRWTERRVHDCGSRTRHTRGIHWMSNDAVNLCGTLAGATVSVLSGALMGG